MNLQKIPLYSVQGQQQGTKELPALFREPIRLDLIKRAVLAEQANARQPYGAKPEAGQQVSAKVSRRRRDYRGSYGHGISRVPRKVLSVRGSRFNWVGALAPGTVKGRKAHPPKAEKVWTQKINDKEYKKAMRSALAATLQKELVKARGHTIPDTYPFIINTDVEALKTTKAVRALLMTLGFKDELARTAVPTRQGHSSRQRTHRVKKAVLFVVHDTCALQKAARNIPGVEVVDAKNMQAAFLAPGCVPGRATLYSEAALGTLMQRYGGRA